MRGGTFPYLELDVGEGLGLDFAETACVAVGVEIGEGEIVCGCCGGIGGVSV